MEEGKFATYSFNSWREMSELRAEIKQPEDDWIRAVNFEIQVPRVIRLLTFDRLPKQKVHLEPPQRVGARRTRMPVLRSAFSNPSAEHRSCGSTKPRRRDHVGERRLRLRHLQREKGRSYSIRSSHETRADSRPPETQSHAGTEAQQSKIRKLGEFGWMVFAGRSGGKNKALARAVQPPFQAARGSTRRRITAMPDALPACPPQRRVLQSLVSAFPKGLGCHMQSSSPASMLLPSCGADSPYAALGVPCATCFFGESELQSQEKAPYSPFALPRGRTAWHSPRSTAICWNAACIGSHGRGKISSIDFSAWSFMW